MSPPPQSKCKTLTPPYVPPPSSATIVCDPTLILNHCSMTHSRPLCTIHQCQCSYWDSHTPCPHFLLQVLWLNMLFLLNLCCCQWVWMVIEVVGDLGPTTKICWYTSVQWNPISIVHIEWKIIIGEIKRRRILLTCLKILVKKLKGENIYHKDHKEV